MQSRGGELRGGRGAGAYIMERALGWPQLPGIVLIGSGVLLIYQH
jgi:hypothetical protein